MSFVEIIGFIISVLALVYIFFKQQSIVRYRQEHPEAFEDESAVEGDPLQELMQVIEQEKAARKVAPHLPPPSPKTIKKPKPLPQYRSLEDYRLTSQIEKRKLETSVEKRRLKSKINPRFEEIPTLLARKPHDLDESKKVGPSRAKVAFQHLSKRRDLLIYHEIMNKPKSVFENYNNLSSELFR